MAGLVGATEEDIKKKCPDNPSGRLRALTEGPQGEERARIWVGRFERREKLGDA